MNDFFDNKVVDRMTIDQASYSEGLRQFMLSVYNYMGLGLVLTGLIAYVFAATPALMNAVMPFMWLFILAPIGLVFFLSFRINKMSLSTAQMTFWAYAALNGVAFSVFFIGYTDESIARVFFITGGMFGATSLYGYTTKKNLASWGSYLFMGLIGILIASVVNIFIGSTALQLLLSVVGVLVFTGLTAYDTQAIKESYTEGSDGDTQGRRAIFGALRLYLDFINLFIMLLRLFGDRR